MAELTEVFVAGVAPHEQKSGQAMKVLSYTVTKNAQNDTVIFSDVSTIVDIRAVTVATGADDPVTLSGLTATLTSAATGATRIMVWGH